MSLTESQHLKYNIKVDAKDSSFNTLVIPSLAFIPLNPESLLSPPVATDASNFSLYLNVVCFIQSRSERNDAVSACIAQCLGHDIFRLHDTSCFR